MFDKIINKTKQSFIWALVHEIYVTHFIIETESISNNRNFY